MTVPERCQPCYWHLEECCGHDVPTIAGWCPHFKIPPLEKALEAAEIGRYVPDTDKESDK